MTGLNFDYNSYSGAKTGKTSMQNLMRNENSSERKILWERNLNKNNSAENIGLKRATIGDLFSWS